MDTSISGHRTEIEEEEDLNNHGREVTDFMRSDIE